MARRPRQAPSLLILQLDSDKLRADGLSFTELTRFVQVVTAFGSGAVVEVRETTTPQHLREELASLEGHFDVIVAIGHSNESGIRIASGEFVDWAKFATLIKRFKPKRLVLIACQAGRWPAASLLFTNLANLRRIFASPVNASRDLGALMIALVPYLVDVKAPGKELVFKTQVLLAAATGRQIRQWMRKDKDNPEGLLLDLAAEAAHPVIQDVRAAIARLLR